MKSINQKEPIAAIATPRGEGGISVIRVSGQGAIGLTNAVFRGTNLGQQASHTAHFGRIVDNGQEIDEVLATVFKSPRSYTGEDTVEISCHGGLLITQAVLETLLTAGARHAEPGEFTQRAFLNGKLELSQAEAVADLIHAKSNKALSAAHQHLDGALGRKVKAFRQSIIDATAMVELELDFIEEDVEFANKEQLARLLTNLLQEIDTLLETYDAGRLVKDGVKTAFVGEPNAGKSTLLNTLVGRDRAIVSEIAGTTRDTIDAEWNYDGLLFTLIDTAGIRQTRDIIEAEGVKRSEKAIQDADLVVYLVDVTASVSSHELTRISELKNRANDAPFLLIGTKSDLSTTSPSLNVEPDLIISAKEGDGLGDLKDVMKRKALANKYFDASSLLITNLRHRDALEKTKGAVESALAALDQGLTGDFLAIDLRSALHELGTITGEITTEDLLDSIFSRFCIGK